MVHSRPDAAGQYTGTIVGKVDAIMGECFDVAVVDAGDRRCRVDVSQMGIDGGDAVGEVRTRVVGGLCMLLH